MICELKAYTECKMVMNKTKLSTDEKDVDVFVPQTCTEGTETQEHTKNDYKCETKKRKSCVQVWKTLANGQKVRVFDHISRLYF